MSSGYQVPVTAVSRGIVSTAMNTPTNFGNTSGELMDSANSQKGGMRGLGLLAVVLAEIAIKLKVIDLQEDYYKTNKKDFDFFKDNHEGPIQQSVSEAFGPNNPTYNYDLYASVPAGIAKAGVIDRQWFEARRRIPKYNTGQHARLDYDMAVARMAAVAAGWNLATRYEFTWTDEHNNRAMDRKVSMANVGIGVGNIVQQGLSASVSSLSTAYDNVGDTIASIGNGYATKRGYEAGRDDTRNRYSRDTQSARGPR